MHSRWQRLTPVMLIVIGLLISASTLAVRAAGPIGTLIMEEAFGARREIQSDKEIDQPTISFIDNPSATCYQPETSRNDCYITWNYLYVTASSSQYIISMTVSIDDRLVAYHSGFFQTSMYVPGDLFGRGFKVACGPRDAIGLGNTYAYTTRARETGGLSAANYGAVRCPGLYQVFLPLVKR
jgi:hypothetical protein